MGLPQEVLNTHGGRASLRTAVGRMTAPMMRSLAFYQKGCLCSVAVIIGEPAGKAFFAYSCTQTRLLGQYYGK